MDWFDSHHGLIDVLIFASGLLVAFIANYLKFSGELAYIKGQLDQILKANNQISDLADSHARIEFNYTKLLKDLDKAFTHIKRIEQRMPGGAL